MHRIPRLVVIHGGVQFAGVVNRLAVHGGDDVAEIDFAIDHLRSANPGVGRGRIRLHAHDQQTRHAKSIRNFPPMSVVENQAKVRTDDFAVYDQFRHDSIDRVDRNGESDPGVRSRRAVDGGVHANQSAGAIQQRAAGIAGIDGGVDLNDVVDRHVVALRMDRPTAEMMPAVRV